MILWVADVIFLPCGGTGMLRLVQEEFVFAAAPPFSCAQDMSPEYEPACSISRNKLLGCFDTYVSAVFQLLHLLQHRPKET